MDERKFETHLKFIPTLAFSSSLDIVRWVMRVGGENVIKLLVTTRQSNHQTDNFLCWVNVYGKV